MGECWCCGHHARLATRGPGMGLCRNCRMRWWRRGYEGNGPGPYTRPPVADSLAEWAPVITRLPAWQAAERIGVSSRTVERWQRALREAP